MPQNTQHKLTSRRSGKNSRALLLIQWITKVLIATFFILIADSTEVKSLTRKGEAELFVRASLTIFSGLKIPQQERLKAQHKSLCLAASIQPQPWMMISSFVFDGTIIKARWYRCSTHYWRMELSSIAHWRQKENSWKHTKLSFQHAAHTLLWVYKHCSNFQ